MGYDLHITRRRRWSDAGRDIAPEEWLALVDKMVAIARVPPASPKSSLRERAAAWLGRLRSRPLEPTAPTALPFRIGDRVRNTWGREGTVVHIDPRAQHGLDLVRIRFDDGREFDYAAVAHDLEPVSRDGPR